MLWFTAATLPKVGWYLLLRVLPFKAPKYYCYVPGRPRPSVCLCCLLFLLPSPSVLQVEIARKKDHLCGPGLCGTRFSQLLWARMCNLLLRSEVCTGKLPSTFVHVGFTKLETRFSGEVCVVLLALDGTLSHLTHVMLGPFHTGECQSS